MNILIIDVGTSSMRGILFRENGDKIHSVQLKYRPVYGKEGLVTQRAGDWSSALYEIVSAMGRKADSSGESIDALSLTSQRSSVIPVDGDGNVLMDAIMWQDTRNKEICNGLKEYDDLLFEKTGAMANTVFSGSKMTWIRQNCPDIYRKTYKFLTVAEYLLYLMTGGYHTDVTYGSRSGLMDIRKRKWDIDLLKLYQVEEERLSVLHEPGDVIGAITDDFARLTGLKEGTPVISAGGDQQCAALGQGAVKEGMLSIVTGTGGFIEAAIPSVPSDLTKEVVCNCSSVPGEYLLETNVLTCCCALDWFGRNFYEKNPGEIDYDRINRDLEHCENVSSTLVMPYFSGTGTPAWNPDAKAVFSNITLSTDKKEMLKGLVEGICMEIKNNIDTLKKYVAVQHACISGGMAQSNIISQIQADVYGITLSRVEDCETSALGALMAAGRSLGVYTDFDQAYKCVHPKGKSILFEPHREKHLLYKNKLKEMNDLYNKIY